MKKRIKKNHRYLEQIIITISSISRRKKKRKKKKRRIKNPKIKSKLLALFLLLEMPIYLKRMINQKKKNKRIQSHLFLLLVILISRIKLINQKKKKKRLKIILLYSLLMLQIFFSKVKKRRKLKPLHCLHNQQCQMTFLNKILKSLLKFNPKKRKNIKIPLQE